MIKLEETKVTGWEAAIRGMRNPMNSWEKSDTMFVIADFDEDSYYGRSINSNYAPIDDVDNDSFYLDGGYGKSIGFKLGEQDHRLMMNLAKAGSVDAKYRRMLIVTVDITAPLYWWKEFDTYKVGTVANSCSTMHKIQAKEFTLEDFSHEHLLAVEEHPESPHDIPFIGIEFEDFGAFICDPANIFNHVIEMLNRCRTMFLETKDKRYWWQMIQLLPTSYNQRRTVLLNYEVLAGIYPKRKNHKLDEWHVFCDWIKSLPYSELITLNSDEDKHE